MLLSDVLDNHHGEQASSSTLTFKKVGDLAIEFDIYHPPVLKSTMIPAVIYWHAGGLITGDRNSVLPHWYKKRAADAGFAFISADYRLIPSGGVTGHEILEDVTDLFAFIVQAEFEHPSEARYRLDPRNLFASGQSAGGLCAYLAAAHATPKPKAVFALYGMLADFFSPYYQIPKTEPFFPGTGILDPKSPMFDDFHYPKSLITPQVSGTELYLENPRNPLLPLYLQMGVYADYWTGEHEKRLKSIDELPEKHKKLFPEFLTSADWPPTLLVHGSQDDTIPNAESVKMYGLLKDKGVSTELIIVEGCDHGFDYMPDAIEKHTALFDTAFQFLKDNVSV